MISVQVSQVNAAITDTLDDPLSNKDRKLLTKTRCKADNLVCIKAENFDRIVGFCASVEGFDTVPEHKPCIQFEDYFCPTLNIGEYVKVRADMSVG